MPNDDWAERWATKNTPWHRADVHSDLIAQADRFLGAEPRRVLVPLCGKTRDVSWLASRGHQVVGVELIEDAVRQLCSEQGIEARVADEGAFRVYRAGRIELFVGDLHELSAQRVGTIDRIWDRGSMVAIPPADRERYAQCLRRLSGPETTVLLSALSYDASVMSGPPWSVPVDEIARVYPDADIELIVETDVIAASPRWQELGHSWWLSSLYSITW